LEGGGEELCVSTNPLLDLTDHPLNVGIIHPGMQRERECAPVFGKRIGKAVVAETVGALEGAVQRLLDRLAGYLTEIPCMR